MACDRQINPAYSTEHDIKDQLYPYQRAGLSYALVSGERSLPDQVTG